MLHHPSEHVTGHAARHLLDLSYYAAKVVSHAVLLDSGGRLDNLTSKLVSSNDTTDRASYAGLIGRCLLHSDTVRVEGVHDAGTVQLVYKLLQQAGTHDIKCKAITCHEVFPEPLIHCKTAYVHDLK